MDVSSRHLYAETEKRQNSYIWCFVLETSDNRLKNDYSPYCSKLF
jgi:hypothetical protein